MRVSVAHSSPNFSNEVIPVSFAVLHYTAADLQRTLAIFGDPKRKVCAHFVLDIDGTVYDLGGFLDGPILKGAHAGESRVQIDGQVYTSLNTQSIGIEIINLNGNIFAYTEAQYDSLKTLLNHLLKRFPDLLKPGHILGHEHIAGFRGKCDPGLRFDWARVLGSIGLKTNPLHQQCVFNDDDAQWVQNFLRQRPQPGAEDWSKLSSELEARIKERQQSLSRP